MKRIKSEKGHYDLNRLIREAQELNQSEHNEWLIDFYAEVHDALKDLQKEVTE